MRKPQLNNVLRSTRVKKYECITHFTKLVEATQYPFFEWKGKVWKLDPVFNGKEVLNVPTPVNKQGKAERDFDNVLRYDEL